MIASLSVFCGLDDEKELFEENVKDFLSLLKYNPALVIRIRVSIQFHLLIDSFKISEIHEIRLISRDNC